MHRSFRVGEFSLDFEPATGWIRDVRFGGRPVLSAVYAAVRDESWGTFGVHVQVEEERATAKGLLLRWFAECAGAPFCWRGQLELVGDSFSYSIEGEAKEPYVTQRTGLCVLHALEGHRGVPVSLVAPDGSRSEAQWPDLISPHQPFRNLAELVYALPGVGQVQMMFRGEVFETEDQRNWSDASYKTYCRPLEWPRPYRLDAGEKVTQTVEVRIQPGGDPLTPRPESREEGRVVFGTLVTLESDLKVLRGLGFRYVALELGPHLAPADLQAWADHAESQGLGIELHWPPEAEPESLVRLAQDVWHAGARLMVGFEAWDAAAVARLRAARSWADPRGAAVVAASWHNFTELNRARPTAVGLDGYGFAANPQVHAFDDRSILETPPVLRDILDTARDFAQGLPIHVGPVTLARRGAQEDSRLAGEVGTGYANGVVQALRQGGATTATLFRAENWLAGTPSGVTL